MRVSELLTSLLQSQIDAARTAVKSLISPVHNAAGYGAIGDGTTNDAAAIQAAIDQNEYVSIPPGIFNLGTTSLKLKSRGQIFLGAGPEVTIFKYTGTSAAITVEGDTSADVPHNITAGDFSLWGADTGAYGLQIGKATGSPRASRGTFRNILAYGFTTAAYHLVSCQIAAFYNCDAEDNPGIGFLLDNPSGGANSATTFYSCRSTLNGQQGLYIKDFFLTCNFYNFVSESNGYEGVRIDGLTKAMYNLRFDNLHCEQNNTGVGRTSGYYEVYIDTGSYAVQALQVRGAYLDIGAVRTSNHALYMAGGGSATIDGLIATASVSGPAYGSILGTWLVRGFGLGTSAFTVANTVRGHFFDVGGDGRMIIESTKSDAAQNYVAFGNGSTSGRGIQLGAKNHTTGTQTPAYGSDTWAVGDMCYNTAPVAGGAAEWQCITAGSPGSWRIIAHNPGWAAVTGATPSVLDLVKVVITQTGATNVTNFINGHDGAELTIQAGDGNTTLVQGATISLRGGINVTLTTGQIVHLERVGTVWTQAL